MNFQKYKPQVEAFGDKCNVRLSSIMNCILGLFVALLLIGAGEPAFSQDLTEGWCVKKHRQEKARTYTVKGHKYRTLSRNQADKGFTQQGTASWYGNQFHNKHTANGEVYDMHGFTAAHKTLPLPSMVKVTNLANGKTIYVKVNDRGPFKSRHNHHSDKRIIDLSRGAFEALLNKDTPEKVGLMKVKIEYIPVDINCK